jgi:putative transposase
VRTIEEECLDRVIVVGERHLRHVIAEFMSHYRTERNHQGLDNEPTQPLVRPTTSGPVRRRQRLGGLLNCYSRAA